jgi:hypothetical protein
MTNSQVSVPFPTFNRLSIVTKTSEKRAKGLISNLWRRARKLAQALARMSAEGAEIHERIQRAKEETLSKHHYQIPRI